MADNVTLDPGVGGATIATDDDGTAQHQYVKVEFGADNTQTKVTSSVGLPTDPLDRAARDCGKVDIAMGQVAHDAAAAAIDPILAGGYASAAAPTSVSADGDAVQAWYLRNGAAATVVTAAGALIGGDAANGLDVDVTRVGGTVAVTQSGTWDEVGINDSGNSITVDNGGTFVVQENGAALTALQVIDNPVVVDDAAFTPATTSVMMAGFEFDDSTPDSVNEGDAGAARMSANRNIYTTIRDAAGNERGLNVAADGSIAITVASVPSHAVTNAGTFAVQVDGAALTAVQKIDDPVLVDDAAFTPATSSVMMAGFEADEGSTDSVDEGDAGAARMTLDRKQIVTTQPHTTGGLETFRSIDLDETEEDIKTSAGQIYGMWVTNTTTATVWLKFYNLTAANTTVGSSTPKITVGIPGNTSDDVAGLFASGNGIKFDTAICAAATTGVADADTGAPSANALIINVFYM
jgi:hypothetical protein